MNDLLIIWGLPFVSLGLAIAAPMLASAGRTVPAWISLLVGWGVWPLLYLIGRNDHSAHGTGALYYLELFALLALPFVSLIALGIAFAISAISGRRARADTIEDTNRET